jgi:iron(III) transport system substrate-binding protein
MIGSQLLGFYSGAQTQQRSSEFVVKKNKKEPTASRMKLVVYTHRNAQLIKLLFDEYKKETGTEIEFLTGEPGALIERIAGEGSGTPADIFISVDSGTLWLATQKRLFSPVESKKLRDRIPSFLRDPQNHWFGLSLRARAIMYNKDSVDPAKIHDYLNLASSEWKGQLCLRSSKKVYNQSLVAHLLSDFGTKKTQETVSGWVRNLAVPVFENDTRLLEAVSRGDCKIAIANSYYLGRLQKENKTLNVGVFFPPNTHMNISGAGIIRWSRNKGEAQKFIEWMTSEVGQKLFADSNLEYPVVNSVDPDPIVKAWGVPKPSKSFPLFRAGELQREAMAIIKSAKYE